MRILPGDSSNNIINDHSHTNDNGGGTDSMYGYGGDDTLYGNGSFYEDLAMTH